MVMSLNAISMPRLGNNLRFLIEPEAPRHHVTLMPPPWKNCLLLISDRSPTRLLPQEAHPATPAAFRFLDTLPPFLPQGLCMRCSLPGMLCHCSRQVIKSHSGLNSGASSRRCPPPTGPGSPCPSPLHIPLPTQHTPPPPHLAFTTIITIFSHFVLLICL